MDERHAQEQEFVQAHAAEVIQVAKALHWNPPGEELHNWAAHLLPDGYACPPDETYAELQNALDYYLDVLRQEA